MKFDIYNNKISEETYEILEKAKSKITPKIIKINDSEEHNGKTYVPVIFLDNLSTIKEAYETIVSFYEAREDIDCGNQDKYNQDKLYFMNSDTLELQVLDGEIKLSDIERRLRIESNVFYVYSFRRASGLKDINLFYDTVDILIDDILYIHKEKSPFYVDNAKWTFSSLLLHSINEYERYKEPSRFYRLINSEKLNKVLKLFNYEVDDLLNF